MIEPPVEPEAVVPRASRRPPLVAIGAGVCAAAALLAALLVALLDPTLFGDTVLDRGAVQRDVAVQFRQREGVAVTVTCPAGMTVVAGGSYQCAGTTATGEHVPIRIVVTRTAPAAYSWTLP